MFCPPMRPLCSLLLFLLLRGLCSLVRFFLLFLAAHFYTLSSFGSPVHGSQSILACRNMEFYHPSRYPSSQPPMRRAPWGGRPVVTPVRSIGCQGGGGQVGLVSLRRRRRHPRQQRQRRNNQLSLGPADALPAPWTQPQSAFLCLLTTTWVGRTVSHPLRRTDP